MESATEIKRKVHELRRQGSQELDGLGDRATCDSRRLRTRGNGVTVNMFRKSFKNGLRHKGGILLCTDMPGVSE